FPKGLRIYLINRKHNDSSNDSELFGKDVVTRNDETMFTSASATPITVDAMSIRNGILRISGFFAFPVNEKNHSIYYRYGDQDIRITDSGRYTSFKVFGQTIYRNFAIDLEIKLRNPGSIYF